MNRETERIGTQSFKFVLLLVLIGGVSFAIWANFYSSFARQRQNIAVAEQFSNEKISPLLRQCKEFKDINAGYYTGDGGCISISGILKTKADFIRLKSLIKSVNPPLPVKWTVKVEEILFETEIEK